MMEFREEVIDIRTVIQILKSLPLSELLIKKFFYKVLRLFHSVTGRETDIEKGEKKVHSLQI